MRKMVFICLLLLILPVSALNYEREPKVEIVSISYLDPQKGITTPISSNYIDRGEKILVVTIYNSAVREKVEYSDIQESLFFNSREEMLFTAYNVEIELEGCEAVKVKTEKIRLPALPSMHTLTIYFPVEIISGDEVELKLKLRYEVIESLRHISIFGQFQRPVENTTIFNTSTGLPQSITWRYQIEMPTHRYELQYVIKEMEIPIKLFIEKKDVIPEVRLLRSDKLIAGGKGAFEVEIKNIGKKSAKNAYAVLEIPKTQKVDTTAMAATMFPFSLSYAMPPMDSSTSNSQTSYFLGDLKPGDFAIASFHVTFEVPHGGVYPVKLKLIYTDEYGNLKESDPVSFGLEVLSKPKIKVKLVESSLYVNSKGDVSVKMVSNSDLKDASARILVNSPLSALSSECYIGDVKAGEDFIAIFRLRASSEAKATNYPADIYVKFKINDDFAESDVVRIGIEVQQEVEFEVLGISEIFAGEEKILTFNVKNTGNAEVKDATARIVIVAPFSSSDDTAFIGNLKAGEIASASFKISVDKDATPKLYALNLEVKYRAENGEWIVSKPTKAIINVKAPPLNYLIYLVVIIILVVGIAYYIRKRMK
ncbi:MAG: S-layer protein [Archaeoglobaceae archaeon]|nr:S-layer protein [Archaeoglobaceae archaeon]MDW7989094.1 S-layer protein [Archaeoglobaceae archaeon]